METGEKGIDRKIVNYQLPRKGQQKKSMFKIKFIKNPPTVENLKSLYESEMYQNLLKKFDKRAKHNLATREWDTTVFYSILTRYQRRYLILNDMYLW